VTKVKPALRGVFHEIGFYVALLAGALLAAFARPGVTAAGAAAYSLSLCTLLGASALYHRPNWQPEARARMRRLDHAAIFVLIAGTYTPIALNLADRVAGERLLWMAWAGAGIGVVKSMFWVHAPKPLTVVLAILLGWLVVGEWSAVARTLGTAGVSLMLTGGVMYTTGAVIYALRRPDPVPAVFGYHEIYHMLVVAAAACHFGMIARLVT
jgi:hemolysin III